MRKKNENFASQPSEMNMGRKERQHVNSPKKKTSHCASKKLLERSPKGDGSLRYLRSELLNAHTLLHSHISYLWQSILFFY